MDIQNHITLRHEFLNPIADTALFYPCCGSDLLIPIELFASVITDFYFIDIKQPPPPKLDHIADYQTKSRLNSDTIYNFLHRESMHKFRLHCWKQRGEDALSKLPKLGVFFYRGDNPVDGEGSSGVLWLGGGLFSQVLSLLVSSGLVVTDGSNCDSSGPTHLSDFYQNREIRDQAMKKAVPFDYLDRKFTCVGYAGEKYGPTLVWQVT